MRRVKIKYTLDCEKIIEGPEEIIDTMVNQFIEELFSNMTKRDIVTLFNNLKTKINSLSEEKLFELKSITTHLEKGFKLTKNLNATR